MGNQKRVLTLSFKKRSLGLFFILFGLLLFNACKKTDHLSPERNQADLAERFLSLPAGSSPELKRVAATLREKNKRANFLNEIAQKNGFPLWDKAVAEKPRGSVAAKSSNSADTIILIPLAQESSNHVDAFIQARLNGSIHLSLYRDGDYSSYGFGSLEDSSLNAEKLAIQFMLLDHETFGHKDFKLLDDRLLKDKSIPSEALTKDRKVHIEPVVRTNGRFILIEYDVCTTSRHLECTTNHSCCPDGSCSACQALCWKTTTTCTKVSFFVSVADDDDFGGGGGSTSPDPGGGGGGGPTTPPNPNDPPPCNPTPLLDNGLPPCTRGDGGGWISFVKIMSNELMTQASVDKDDWDSYFIDPSLQKPRPTFASVKNNALPPSDWQTVANTIGGEVATELQSSNNTCATRVSYALNYAGSPIPPKSYTFRGQDNKNYIMGAKTMLQYLIQAYGTSDPNTTIHLTSTPSQPLTESYIKSQLQGKQGIYVLIPKDPTIATGFGASGHVDILDSNGNFSSGHAYYDAEGGVKEVYLFILN